MHSRIAFLSSNILWKILVFLFSYVSIVISITLFTLQSYEVFLILPKYAQRIYVNMK